MPKCLQKQSRLGPERRGYETMRKTFSRAVMIALAALAACNPAAAKERRALPSAPDEAEILAAVDKFFLALAAGDAAGLDAMFAPDAVTLRLAPDGDQPPRAGRAADLVAAFRDGKASPVVEPYWDPIVLQRKSLALVWAPYEAIVNDARAHCGIDAFQLSRRPGGWIIDAVSYTVEPDSCEELKPKDKSSIRPKFQ